MIGKMSAKCSHRRDETAGRLLPYSRFDASMPQWVITVLVLSPEIQSFPSSLLSPQFARSAARQRLDASYRFADLVFQVVRAG